MRYVALVFLLASCGYSKKHAEKDAGPNDRIAELRQKYLEIAQEFKSGSDNYSGWPSLNDCDGTLWAGLARAGGMATVNLDLAEIDRGRIVRRPTTAGPCWSPELGDTGSKSTISNDMLTGYMWGRWREGNLPALQRLAAYGEANNWVMGEPSSEAARVILRPNGIGLLGRMIYALSDGTDTKSYRKVPALFGPVAQDYERHLQALGIVLNGEVTNYLDKKSLDATVETEQTELTFINDFMLASLRDLVNTEPENPLFHASLGLYTGDFNKAVDLLLDNNTPIPTYVRGDRADMFWLAQRLFATSLVLRKYEE